MLPRVLMSALLLFSVIFLPIWVSLILALVGMMYFDRYGEAVLILLLSDLLYGTSEAKFLGTYLASFVIGVIMLSVVELSKTRLKFYP